MNMFKKNGGFTLVELIVVIAILAILAGVAVPAYSGYIERAKDAAVITKLDALTTAVQAANARAGEVKGIVVAQDGKTVDITTDVDLATDFADNFKLFFNDSGASLASKKITLSDASKIDFSGSSYEEKGATWAPSEWKVTGTQSGGNG